MLRAVRLTRLLRIGASHNDLTTNLVSLGVLLSVTVFTATSAITLMADEHHKEHFYNPTEAARLQWYVPYVAHLRRAPLHAPYVRTTLKCTLLKYLSVSQ